MKTKKIIEQGLKDLSRSYVKDNKKGVTTRELAQILDLKRTHTSHLLNRLVEEKVAYKSNSRPVHYIHNHVLKDHKKLRSYYGLENLKERTTSVSFSGLIGSNGSLKNIIQQCKSAVLYPPNGLPMLIIGESGVGKSYLAEKIYSFAQKEKQIKKGAKFIVFNCAEYAENNELISSAIFGHKKGAFTGASTDKEGLLHEADGGFLFLDEIHRLTPESQEKLFLFLDKGIYRPLGESGEWRKAKVRLVFATTQEPSDTFLRTFLRRIPLTVKIPNYHERPRQERINLVRFFFWKESIKIKQKIVVTSIVMKLLVETTLPGNIGKLENTIRLACASAYSQHGETKTLMIELKHISQEYLMHYEKLIFKGKSYPRIVIDFKQKYKDLSATKKENQILNWTNDILNNYSSGVYWEEFVTSAYPLLNQLIDMFIFAEKRKAIPSPLAGAIKKIVTYALNEIQRKYGIDYYGNSIEVLVALIDQLHNFQIASNDNRIGELIEYLKENDNKSYQFALFLIEIVNKNIEISISEVAQFYIIMYCQYLNRPMKRHGNSIIIAHGYATASSIASVANRLLGEYIYDAIDMPLNMSAEEIGKKLKKYVSKINQKEDLIILVDMGSLEKIYLSIKSEYAGNIGIINNISTQLALKIGTDIMNKRSIDEILKSINTEKNLIQSNYFPSGRPKGKTIVITCSTGIGMAKKIEKLLLPCFENESIKLIASEFYHILENQLEATIFKQNDVQLILGTIDPKIPEIPFLSIEELILEQSQDKMYQYLDKIIDSDVIKKINDKIVGLFTLENVLNNVSILNPNKITLQVESALNRLERAMNLNISNKHRISLTIHICCMIERLVIKDPIDTYKTVHHFADAHQYFIKVIREVFRPIEKEYNVEIPVSEIGYIYDNIRYHLPQISF